GPLDRFGPAGQPVADGQYPTDLVPRDPDGFDSANRGSARRYDILDDQAAVAFAEQRALDLAPQGMGFGFLAHEEGLDIGATGQRRARDRVCTHRHAP